MKSAYFNFQNHSFHNNPILIIDREGLIGEPLSLKLAKEFFVFFVSLKSLNPDVKNKNIMHIPFLKKFPIIPDNKYSHILFIDKEGQDLEILPKIIEKARDVNADLIFAQGLSSKGGYAFDGVLRAYPSAKVALLGDIFANELIFRKENLRSAINRFIYQAQRFGGMQILGDGMRETYPVLLADVVNELIDLVFGIHRNDSLFYIFPKYPPSELALAHMIQKINPEITIDFIKSSLRLEGIFYPPNGKNLLGEKYPLAKKIRSIDIKKKIQELDERERRGHKKIKSPPVSVLWAIILLLLFPLIFTMFFSFLSQKTLYYAKEKIDQGSFTVAKGSIHLSQAFFYLEGQAFNALSFQAKLIGHENNLKKLRENMNLGYKISDILSQAFNAEDYFSKIANGKSTNPIADFVKGENFLKNSIVALEKLKVEEKIPEPILQNLEIVNPLIKLLSSISEVMPNVFGMEGPKTYLILFLNNTELRPGGGVIGSYGVLKFDMGRITELSLHDVSDADSQLRGHVDPPFAARRYLQEEHWYMKDSNFDVDFVKSADSISHFFFVETGQKADGIIAVNAPFIRDILHIIGPVYIADYGKNVDESNFYTSMQFHTQNSFISGATQEDDFLRILSEAIITKLTKENAPYLLIAQSISDALAQKQLLFISKDWQNIFTVNGWSSSLWDERKDTAGTINDFVAINEANLGFNLSSFIKRQVLQKITIDDVGNISEELTVNYKNTSTTQLGGIYKNYLRVILPKDVKLSEISIDGQPQKLVDAIIDPLIYGEINFKPPQGLEVERTTEENKTIFGFLVHVPVGEIAKVKLKYVLSGSISGLDNYSYNLKLFKQPGIESIPYSFSFFYPKSFNITKSSSGVIGGSGNATYFEKIITDKNLIIDFAKNK